jgi:hypothetical protein
MISRSTGLVLPLLFAACASTTQRPVHPAALHPVTLQVVVPKVTGYLFRELGPLVRRRIVEDFRTTVGEVTLDRTDASQALLVVTIVPVAFGSTLPHARLSSDSSLGEQVLWFDLRYTIRTAAGVVRRGSVNAYGPPPYSTRSLDQNAGMVIGIAVTQLSRRVSRALSKS